MEFEFNLNGPIENLDKVPAHYHQHFTEGEGGFTVSEAFVPIAKELNGLNGNLTKVRSSLTKANGESATRRQQLSAFDSLYDGAEGLEDRTPEALANYIQSLRTQATQGGADGAAAQAEIDRIKKTMTESHNTALAERDGTIETLNKEIRTLMVDGRISRAVAAQSGNPTLLTPMLERECDVKVNEDGERVVVILDAKTGQPRYSSTGDLLTIEERVSELKEDQQFAAAFKGQVPGGTGSPQGSNRVKSKTNGAAPDYSKMTPNTKAKSLIAAGMAKRRAGGRR